MKFNVGDNVRLVNSQGFKDHDRNLGKEAVIYKVNNDSYGLEWEDGETSSIYFDADDTPNEACDGDDCLELIEEEGEEVEEVETPRKEAVTLKSVNEIIGQEKNVELIKLAGAHNIPALLIGDTGTGKTTMVKYVAEEAHKQWVRFNLTGETTVDDFVGKFTLKGGETVWQDGILLQAMKKGEWLVVDEINVALPEILFVLHSLLDDDRFVVVANNDGKIVRPHPDFRFFATMNPVSEYSGTKELNKAFQSRFGVIVNVDYPDPGTEAIIIHAKTGIGMEHAAMMADLGMALRQAKKEDKIFYTCSTRDLIQWAQLAIITDIKRAFEVTVLNKSNGDAEAVNKIAKVVIKGYQDIKKAGYTANAKVITEEWEKISKERAQLDEDKITVAARKKAVEELAHELLKPKVTKATVKKAVKATK